ncbi:MAG: GTP-binding protein [Asgard group archaeon]|nr:GTP-binding protein [Asgard group archaeon]
MLFDYLFKTIIVGDPNVGKTSITLRFATGMFRERYLPTIGVEFSVKDIEIDGKRVKLQAWDTGSHDRFSYVRPLYYKGSYGVLVVYDLTNHQSFENLDKWFTEVFTNCETVIPAIIIGNKADLDEERAISDKELLEYANSKKKEYDFDELETYEVSAKNGQNINDIYYELTKKMIEKSTSLED